MKKKQNYAILPYEIDKIDDHYLVSNYLGSWILLDKVDFKRFHQMDLTNKRDTLTEEFFLRLHDKGMIVTENNLPLLINAFRRSNSNLFSGPVLHIAVIAPNCNLSCGYCQAKTDGQSNMDKETAKRMMEFIDNLPERSVKIELQGGEPLLNWGIIKFLAGQAKKMNKGNKNVKIAMVTNGTLLDEEKCRFIADNDIDICISLDGPKNLHDMNRKYDTGKGSYDKTIAAIKRIKRIHDKKRAPRSLSFLPTITKESLKCPEDIINEYVKLGAETISLRPMNCIGNAKAQWGKIGYSPDEFNKFWKKSIDYMLALNEKNIKIRERTASHFLSKILEKKDPNFVDIMCPCGAGRKVLTYLPNGDIYPCDESRMMGDDMFKLGNLRETKDYSEILQNPGLIALLNASYTDFWEYNSALKPWLGICPVVNYSLQGNLVPKISVVPLHQIYKYQLRYLFKKMINNQNNKEIFRKWAQ